MILTTIDGIPVYSTIEEALAWAKINGLEKAHVHRLVSGFGYMGGAVDDPHMVGAIETPPRSIPIPVPPEPEPEPEPLVPEPIVSRVAAAPQVAITPLVPLTTTTGGGGGY